MQFFGGTLITLAATVGVNPAEAALLFTLTEVGSDVVLEGSGTADLSGLTFQGSGIADGGISPNSGILRAGEGSSDIYNGIPFARAFGSGGFTLADSSIGGLLGFQNALLLVPAGYSSGNFVSSTSTFSGASFTSLGVTPGTYTWTWGSGANADSATLEVVSSTAAVPEPMTILGTLTALGFGAAFKRRQAKS